MRVVTSASEIGAAVSWAKADASGYCSNLFPSPQKFQDWIEHGELFYDQRDGVALFLRRDREFWRLYFCAGSPTLLQAAITALPILRVEPVVLDIVGQEQALADIVGMFESTGFRCYNRLYRMARNVQPGTLSAAVAPDPRVTLASKADCQSILDLLFQSFDSRAEQIPMLYEIEAAVESGQIWVVRCEVNLEGLLFFETQGLTSTLRYWLIAERFRTQRFGSGLMQRYFAGHPAVRRFLLWVIADNDNVIAKYRHYGFVQDGLVDQVMANEIIRI
jgi:hypothetical protein